MRIALHRKQLENIFLKCLQTLDIRKHRTVIPWEAKTKQREVIAPSYSLRVLSVCCTEMNPEAHYITQLRRQRSEFRKTEARMCREKWQTRGSCPETELRKSWLLGKFCSGHLLDETPWEIWGREQTESSRPNNSQSSHRSGNHCSFC